FQWGTPFRAVVSVVLLVPVFPLVRSELEIINQIVLFGFFVFELCNVGLAVLRARNNYVGPTSREAAFSQFFVEPVLVEGARLSVHSDKLCFEAVRIR